MRRCGSINIHWLNTFLVGRFALCVKLEVGTSIVIASCVLVDLMRVVISCMVDVGEVPHKFDYCRVFSQEMEISWRKLWPTSCCRPL